MNISPAGAIEPDDHLVGGRPEDTVISDDHATSHDQGVAATVVLVEHLGHEAQVVCAVDDHTTCDSRCVHHEVNPAFSCQR